MHSFGISYFVHWPLAYPCTYSAVHIHVGGAIQCTVHTPPSDVQCVRHLSAMGGLVYTFRNPAHAVIGARLSLLGSARRGAWVEVHLYGQPTSTKYYHAQLVSETGTSTSMGDLALVRDSSLLRSTPFPSTGPCHSFSHHNPPSLTPTCTTLQNGSLRPYAQVQTTRHHKRVLHLQHTHLQHLSRASLPKQNLPSPTH